MKKVCLLTAAVAAFVIAHAQTPMKNGDFETWTTETRNEPIGWTTDNMYSTMVPPILLVTRVAGTTNFGIRLETIFANGFPYAGYFSNGSAYSGQGGTSYANASAPTSLNGMWKYGIMSNDSARIDIVFKKNGSIIGRDTFFRAGSQASFTAFSLPLATLPTTPDSFIISVYSGNFGSGGKVGSYIELDELQFGTSAAAYPVPNGSFNWGSTTVVYANYWRTSGNAGQTTDRLAGTYAMKLSSKDNGAGLESGMLSSPLISINPAGIDTLTGWYKYIPAGNDHAGIGITLYDIINTNEELLGASFPPSSSYVFFSIPLTNTIAAGGLSFDINSSSGTPVNGSTFYVDNLAINGHPITTAIQPLPAAQAAFQIYPNPARDMLHIASKTTEAALQVSITDMAGREVAAGVSSAGVELSISLLQLPPGVYSYQIKQGAYVQGGKLLRP